jgi:MoaA/NifB/PqqE/SkfB family radical SAM enzyme
VFNTKKDFAVKAPYLSILNQGHFMTQIAEDETKQSKPSLITKCKAILSSLQTKSLNDVSVVDTIPCYAGHIYSRVLVTGEVIPCCKEEKKPMGNVYHDSFATIWNSSSYQTFRKKAVLCKKNDAYFKPIDCYSSCDNYGKNLQFDEMVKNDHLF